MHAEAYQTPATPMQHCPEIYHLKTANRSNWGNMPAVLKRIEVARARGLDITANIYPYTASSNPLEACLPVWVREGGVEKMLARLNDPAQRERIRTEMDDPRVTEWENQYHGAGGGEGILVVTTYEPTLRKYEGLTLAQIGKQLGKDPRDVAMDIVIADRGFTRAVNFVMSEDDVRAGLRHPLVSVGTDSAAMAQDGPLSPIEIAPSGLGDLSTNSGEVRSRRRFADAGGGNTQNNIDACRSRSFDR